MHEDKITRRTVTASVIDILREKIISNEIKSGAPLRQDALANQLGVSRIPIREALLQLEAEGLVQFTPHKGAVATEISVEEVDELFGLRSILECDVLSRSMPKMTGSDMHKAELALKEFDGLLTPGADMNRWGKLNWKFHESLYLPAGRERTVNIISQLHTNCDRYLRLQIQIDADFTRAEAEHHDLLEMCRQHDTRAARKCLKNHILTTGKKLTKMIKSMR